MAKKKAHYYISELYNDDLVKLGFTKDGQFKKTDLRQIDSCPIDTMCYVDFDRCGCCKHCVRRYKKKAKSRGFSFKVLCNAPVKERRYN